MERRKLLSTFPNFLNLKFPARPRGIQQNEIREHLGRKGPKNPEWRKQQALHQGLGVKRTSDSFLGAFMSQAQKWLPSRILHQYFQIL